ncbi:SDR family oxidoreductase [Luteimonas vadosa]|uniref:SDR family oxidoreductase n=1 Tax=Luteimonas vadosa TaxID=1165507 RepID=A0ABP9E3R0_9GAMM
MAALAAIPLQPVWGAFGKPRKILILGGTNFVGPHLVHGSHIAGHEVTLFNRGITNAHLFPGVEKLRGDRTRNGGLRALEGGRKWDVVIDTWPGHPKTVFDTTKLLSGRADSYVYVSSIAVYGDFRKVGLTEHDRILSRDKAPDLSEENIGYAWAKRLGEAAVSENFDGAGVVVRGSSILGYDYSMLPTNQSTYWPLRMRAGGDVVVPDDRDAMVQWSDAASLADFAVKVGSERLPGTFNAVHEPMPFHEFLKQVQAIANPGANLVWVPQDIMEANGGTPFETVPLWIPGNDPEPGFYQFEHSAALAAGMRVVPLQETVRNLLKTFRSTAPDYQPAWRSSQGLPQDIEQRILEAYRSTVAGISAADELVSA